MAEPLPISAVVLAHNEAANLPRCLRALRGCADVVVVDDGSTDDSPRIAAECGARVKVHPFDSFADQRNWALDSAGLRCDWTLHLDADEVATPQLIEELRCRLPSLATRSVGFLARKVMLEERWLRFSADYPVFADAVYLREPVLHYNFSKGWAEWRARHLRYAAAEAARIRSGAVRVAWGALFADDRVRRRAALRALSYRLPGRPALRFLYAYVWRRGFLDGAPGLRFCLAMAAYERMINAALDGSGKAPAP